MKCIFFLFFSLSMLQSYSQRDEKMSATIFKHQEFARAEPVEEFPYEVQFSIVSAKVYFTGANFKGVEQGEIKGGSLKPVADLKARCIPGSIVIFDDVKVLGPDKVVRTIPGVTYMLK